MILVVFTERPTMMWLVALAANVAFFTVVAFGARAEIAEIPKSELLTAMTRRASMCAVLFPQAVPFNQGRAEAVAARNDKRMTGSDCIVSKDRRSNCSKLQRND
jgi:hypothetical protein